MANDDGRLVSVEINGLRYPIRSTLDAAYVADLAAYVEQKMHAASDAAPASDGMGLAILVALNIADEYFRARDSQSSGQGELNERALRLEALVDGILAQVADQKAVNAT